MTEQLFGGSKRPYMIELFAGAGGLALGLEMAGFITRALVEIDPYCCQTLRVNAPKYFPHAVIIEEDIRRLSGRDILQYAKMKKTEVFLISGGPPCQGFSIAKTSKGGRNQDPRDHLIWDFVRIVNDIKPHVFIFENVPGIISKFSGLIFRKLLDAFQDIGYTINYAILNSADYGVPQIRKRLFILGSKHGLKLRFPKPTHAPHSANGLKPYVTIRQAFSKLTPEMPNQELPRHTKKKIEKLNAIKPGSAWRKWHFRDDFDSPSRCITGHCRDDWIHPLEPRAGTVRELATIQTYPYDYVFYGPIMGLNSSKFHFQYRQVGNSVPVLLAKALGEEILRQLSY
jgi:DNA (cytosine-5)-methyltransferase 1